MAHSDDPARELRVGITGHRRVADAAALRALIEEATDELLLRTGRTELRLWSSLAEGADRVGAQVAVDRDYPLHVVLPLPVEDYGRDFPDTIAEFERLLARAATIEVVPDTSDGPDGSDAPTREDAYLAAGSMVLAETEALIAVWSGQPARGRGGTAEIVALARQSGHALAWIRADNGPDEKALPGPTISYEGLPAARH